jgi:Sulfotransferase domain
VTASEGQAEHDDWSGPDFLIVGAQRCGTTFLYAALVEHPMIAKARRKEVHFFDNAWAKGLNWYRGCFPSEKKLQRTDWSTGQKMLTGEASPYYLFHPLAPERIQTAFPKVKLIVLLRDPVQRAHSQYLHCHRSGWETLSFEEALKREDERLEGEEERIRTERGYRSQSHQHHSYRRRGVYVDQLRNWSQLFPAEQIHIVQSEQMYRDHTSSLKQILSFLGLPKWTKQSYWTPPARDRSSLSKATEAELREFYTPHNQRLYEFLERDLGW